MKESYRGKEIAKTVISELDKEMIKRGIISMLVTVIPRNTSAIKLYKECGFDHLNMIELRKNYDKSLDKDEYVNILGFEFKKY